VLYLPKLIERNLRRHARRTVLTSLVIAMSTFVLAVLIAVPASMNRVIQEASEGLRLVVNNRTAPQVQMPARYCQEIDRMTGVAACVAVSGWFSTWRDVSQPIFCAAAGPEVSDVFPDYGISPEDQKTFMTERRAAVAGALLMKRNGWKVGSPVTLRGTDARHFQMEFLIVGEIANERYPNTLLIRRDYLMETRKANGMGDEDTAWQLFVRADGANLLGPLQKQIDSHFMNSSYQTRTMTESDALASRLSVMGDLRSIVAALCATILLFVLLTAGNSNAIAVRERLSEMAIMRALGFGPVPLAMMLFGECAAIGAIGGALGAGLAFYLFVGGLNLPVLGVAGALWVTQLQVFVAFITAVGVSILSGIAPIAEALLISPSVAFRKLV
jgi:putative ABC transport system permease protein